MRERVTYHSAVFIAILVAAVMVVLDSCKPTAGHVLGGPDDSLEIGVAATTVDTTLLKEYGLTGLVQRRQFAASCRFDATDGEGGRGIWTASRSL